MFDRGEQCVNNYDETDSIKILIDQVSLTIVNMITTL